MLRTSRRNQGLQPELIPSDSESGGGSNAVDSDVGEDVEELVEKDPEANVASSTSADIDMSEDKEDEPSDSSEESDSDAELIVVKENSEYKSLRNLNASLLLSFFTATARSTDSKQFPLAVYTFVRPHKRGPRTLNVTFRF